MSTSCTSSTPERPSAKAKFVRGKGVLAAVDAGIGVALLSSRSTSGDVIPWTRGADLDTPRRVVNVARVARGATSEVAAELLADIRAELGEVPAEAA